MRLLKQLGNSQLIIEDRPIPEPGAGEVVIKTVVSAICGSEMRGYWDRGYPTGNMGHEAAGMVAELGRGVNSLSVGQRVGCSAIAGGGDCNYCKKGQYTWCENYRFIDNMHAEYFCIPALACHALPDDVPWDVGVLITGDGLGVPFHTSTKITLPDVRTVAVFGLGPVGLGNVMFQSFLGRQVIGIERWPVRIKLATALGAKHTVFVDDTIDVAAVVRGLTEGRGADVCIEAAGAPTTAKQCFASVRKGGVVIFNGEQPSVDLSPSEDFIRRDITAIGSWFYHFHEFTRMLAIYRQGLPVESLVTHHFPLEQSDAAYCVMCGQSGKVLFVYNTCE